MVFQLGSALLDACVLAVLDKQDAYGYVLTQNVKTIIDISESTLYPVLRRLQKDEMLTTYDSAYNGRNRRYYKITDKGRERFTFLKEEWDDYKENVDAIMKGGTIYE